MNPSPYTALLITQTSDDGTEILGKDGLGKTWVIKGSTRPKGTAMPAVGESWLADKSAGFWRLVAQYGVPPASEVSNLDDLVEALGKMGLVVPVGFHSGVQSIPSAYAWTPLRFVISTNQYQWAPYGQGFHVPAYNLTNGIVRLRGVASGGATGSVISVLPPALRPTASKSFITSGSAPGGNSVPQSLVLDKEGNLTQFPAAAGGSAFVSLEQITYTVTDA